MTLRGNREAIWLFVGDMAVFYLALWLTLALRYGRAPDAALWWWHFVPFSIIFLFWLFCFFIFDLYRRPRLLFRQRLSKVIINAQILNSLLAVVFFYFIPYFAVTPKTNLFINLILSLALLLIWRLYLVTYFLPSRPEQFVLACTGAEVDEIKQALASQPSLIVSTWDDWLKQKTGRLATIIINTDDVANQDQLARYYRLVFTGVSFISVHQLYELLFERVPVALISHGWFLTNISNRPKIGYNFFKRVMDISLAGVLGLVTSPLYLLVALAIKLEDGGAIFYTDTRIGRSGRPLVIHKFRSMSLEPRLEDRHVTWVGQWIRPTRIDELPQLWSVIRGGQSLIGPRPEKPEYVALYREQIPYYDTRHLIAPGLSGWAQLYQENHPHFQAEIDATREKLSYDLYYLKNRSWWLDVKIALKTIRALLSRTGI